MSTYLRIERTCEFCGNEFIAKTSVTRYCSRRCNNLNYKRKNISFPEVHKNESTSNQQAPEITLKTYEFFELSEAAHLMRISKRTLFRLITAGKLTKKKIGSRTVIPKHEIKRFFNNQIN